MSRYIGNFDYNMQQCSGIAYIHIYYRLYYHKYIVSSSLTHFLFDEGIEETNHSLTIVTF